MENRRKYETENKTKNKPQVKISVTNLDMEIEEGKVFKGSFLVTSENGVPIKGKVFSTNDKMGLEAAGLSGTKKEVAYYFKGKTSLAGSETWGDFVILTNGGEYNIPYHIRVVPKAAKTSVGIISDMNGFTELYDQYPQEAMELFFLSSFSDVFLKSEPEKKAMYHSLMKSRSKALILEEFMTAAGYKDQVSLEVEQTSVVLNKDKDSENIVLKLSGPGYLEGSIYSEKNQVFPSIQRFSSRDFQDGLLAISLVRNQKRAAGNDIIHITTIRQDLTVSAEWWEESSLYKGDREKQYNIKQLKAELMHNYLYFRTGSIGFEDFAQEAHHILEDLLYMTEDMVWKLYLMHLLLMEQSVDEAGELEKEAAEYAKQKSFPPLAFQYFLYLKAMLSRTPDSIGEAVASIRKFYETSGYKAEALWMLIYLDREYVYNKRLVYDTIKQLFQAGNNSSLLYFEACEILNGNPGYMEEAGAFEISIFRWGVRYGFVSMSLAYQFARLSLKLKFYSKSIFSVAERLYKVEPDESFLQVICSLLIKGNKYGKEYHGYFYDAVEANLKIVGLNEFFIRSMDFGKYEKIPRRVLIYFTYSNSLDYVEKAYLYTNILKNKDAYEEVFGAYYSKMLPFVEEQLLKGHMNEHLAYLYTHFQEEILEKPENTKAVCDVLFCRRIKCDNPRMIGVYIHSPETGEENYYPLSGGSTYVQLVNQRAGIYFVDSQEQRYASGIEYTILPFLTLEQMPDEWISRNLSNRKILQTLSDKVDGKLTGKELSIFKKIAFNEDYLPWMRSRALESLLRYYENHQDKKELARLLDRTDYSDVSPGFRKQLMDYYLEVGMTENAFFGAELYGAHIMGAAKQLKLATFGVKYHEFKLDETTLSLAYSASVRKKYNRDTLRYMMEYFDGELEDLLTIWERSRKMELPTAELEKKIINQSMFTGNNTTGVFPIFESLYAGDPNAPETKEFLEYLSALEMHHEMELPEPVYLIIGKEIAGGRIKDKRIKIKYLYYFADKKNYHEQMHDTAEMIISDFLKEEFYLPVYQAFSQWVVFPIDYSERTFLTYHGSPGESIVLYYQIDGEKEDIKERHLLEVLPGLYITSLHFYQSDHVNYRLEIDGEPVADESDVLFETFDYEGDDSRFFELNYLAGEKSGPEELKKYLLKAFFADEFITLL